MKRLITGGLCLALGWLVGSAAAQESTQWKAAPTNGGAVSNTSGVRPAISLSQPTPLESPAQTSAPSFRVFQSAPPSVVRAQKADEKVFEIEPLPTGDDKKTPKAMPKDKNFIPPPPTPVSPTPIADGIGASEGCGNGCGSSCCGLGSRIFSGGLLHGCGSGLFQGCGNGCPDGSYRCWVSAEYLMWRQKGQDTPPLVTRNDVGTATGINGVLPIGQVVYDHTPNYLQSGGRFAMGTWFPRFCCNLGVDVNFFFLARQSSTALFTSNGDPQFSRPFFDVLGQTPAAEFVTINNATDKSVGLIAVRDFTQLWGAGANLRYKLRSGPNCWVDVLFGYRHLDLSEGIDITEDVQNSIVNTLPDNSRTIEMESFHTRNQFNGFLMGLNGECRLWNRAFFGWSTNVSLGNMYQVVNIDGSTTFLNSAPFADGTQKGALLASPTNIGRFTQNRFAVVPEIGLKVGYDLTDHLRVFVGYDFLYMSNVVRPGDQIDLNVNPAFRPVDGKTPGFGTLNPLGSGPPSPRPLLRTTDYWAQGLSFGLMYRY